MKQILKSLQVHPLIWLIGIGLPVFLVNFFARHPGISGWDMNFYYSYAGAIAGEGSLELESAYKELFARGADPKIFDPHRRTTTGRVYNYFPMGHPLLHTPATFLGSLLSNFFETEAGAFSITAQLFYCLSCIILAGIGLWLMQRQLREIFEPEAVTISLYVMIACSMLGYYWFVLPAHSHTSTLFLVGLIITLFSAILKAPAKSPWLFFLLGVTIGYNTMVRLQDAGFVFFAFVVFALLLFQPMRVIKKLLRVFLVVAGGVVGFLPQLLLWKWKDGAWIVLQYQPGSYFSWTRPELLKVLFSPRHGLFYWHPALAAAFVSFLLMALSQGHKAKKYLPLLLSLLLTFFSILYIGASYSIWWFGESFGSRPFLSLTPLFLCGFAWLWVKVRKNIFSRVSFLIIAGILALWNLLLALAFHLSWISRSERVDFAALFQKLRLFIPL